MREHTHQFRRFDEWSATERRLIFNRSERQKALDDAEQQGVGNARPQTPEEKYKSVTEKLAKEFERINKSWVNTLTFQRGRKQRQALNKFSEEKIAAANPEWNASVLGAIWRYNERRNTRAQVRAQMARDVLTLFRNRETELLQKKQAVGGTLAWLRGSQAVISRQELRTIQKMKGRAQGMVSTVEKNVPVLGKAAYQRLESLREAEGIVRDNLEKKLTPSEVTDLLSNLQDGTGLYQAIKKNFADDGPHCRNLLRIAKSMVKMRRYKSLEATESDIPNTLSNKEKIKRIAGKSMMWKDVVFSFPNKDQVRLRVVKQSSPLTTLKVVGEKNQYAVLDMKDGHMLVRHKGFDEDVNAEDKRVSIQFPSGSLRAAA